MQTSSSQGFVQCATRPVTIPDTEKEPNKISWISARRRVVSIRVEDIPRRAYAIDRATVRQKKSRPPVKFELTDHNRQAIDEYLGAAHEHSGEYLFTGRRDPGMNLSTRQYARLVFEWIESIGLDPLQFGTLSLRRTKATLIHERTGNLGAVQLLLGHTKIESMVRYLAADDALAMTEHVDV